MTIEQPPRRVRNVPAVVGVVIAVVAVVLSIGTSGLGVLLPVLLQRTGSSVTQIAGLFAIVGAVMLLVHVVVAVLGLVGLLIPDRPRAMAGVAFGIGAAGAVTTLANLVVPPLIGTVLSS